MYVANTKEEMAALIEDVVRRTTRQLTTTQTLTTVTSSTDPDAILTYEDAGALVGKDPETIRAWTQKKGDKAPKLRRYKLSGGRSAGVKRRELLSLFVAADAGEQQPEPSPDDIAGAILNPKKTKR